MAYSLQATTKPISDSRYILTTGYCGSIVACMVLLVLRLGPFGNTPSHTISYHTIPYHTHTIPYHTIPIPYHSIPIPYHTIPYHTIPYPYHTHTIPIQYHTIPYNTIPYHIIADAYHTIPYRTIPSPVWLFAVFGDDGVLESRLTAVQLTPCTTRLEVCQRPSSLMQYLAIPEHT